MYQVAVAIECSRLPIDQALIRRAVEIVLREAQIDEATVSVAVVDDATIRKLNARFLNHDYATDVLSFVLEQDGATLDGEVIVSADTAVATAQRLGCPPVDELLLYLVHGTLHLVGYDDLEPELRQTMRRREREVLAQLGIEPRYDENKAC
jgi:probable rRNA maturation factor